MINAFGLHDVWTVVAVILLLIWFVGGIYIGTIADDEDNNRGYYNDKNNKP